MTVSNGSVNGLCEIAPVKSVKFWKRSLSVLYVPIIAYTQSGYRKVRNRLSQGSRAYAYKQAAMLERLSCDCTETQNRALKKAEVYDKWYVQYPSSSIKLTCH
jgi:hypothetical protein